MFSKVLKTQDCAVGLRVKTLNTLLSVVNFQSMILWWHISAARYEIAIVIILENFHENSKFPGNFI